MGPSLFITMPTPSRLASCLSGNLQHCVLHVYGIVSSCCVCVHLVSNRVILYIKFQLRCLNSHVFHLQSQRSSDYGDVLPEVTSSVCKSRFPLWTPARYTHDQGKYRSLHLKASVHDHTEPWPGSLWNTERYLTGSWLERGGSRTLNWTQWDKHLYTSGISQRTPLNPFMCQLNPFHCYIPFIFR